MNAYEARDAFVLKHFGRTLAPFQKEISNQIIDCTLHGKGQEIPIEVSRQSGKTTAVVDTLSFLKLVAPEYLKIPVGFGVFAPQFEQAKTDFDRLKDNLDLLKPAWGFDYAESNGNTLELKQPDIPASTTYAMSLGEGTNNESKTLHLQVFEEAQKINDKKMMIEAFPMGAATNAPRVFIGTSGFKLCYFYNLIQAGGPSVLRFPYDEVIKQKRQLYEQTGDPRHLLYEKFINGDPATGQMGEMERLGYDSDEFKTQYRLIWALEAGMFTTRGELASLRDPNREILYQEPYQPCYAGIDSAKSPDSWVATVGRKNGGSDKLEILAWLELQGDNYMDMCQATADFFKHFNVLSVSTDSTGQGDFVRDWFTQNTSYQMASMNDQPIKFTLQSKDILYKNLTNLWRNKKISYPYGPEARQHPSVRRFEAQMLTLEKEYKGQFLSCHHPDSKDAHDDYADSLALMAYAATYGGFADPSAVSAGGVSPISTPPAAPAQGYVDSPEARNAIEDNPLTRDISKW